jgi:hypothetical protein
LIAIVLSSQAVAAPPEISNPAEPPAVQIWALHEVWRLDNEDNSELPLLGTPTQALVDTAGHVYVLDSQMARVLKISPEGRFLDSLGRAGQGPGELDNPNTLLLRPGGEIGLVQVFPGRVVFLDRDGRPAGSMSAQGSNAMFQRVEWARDAFVVAGKSMVFGDDSSGAVTRRFLARYGIGGERGRVFLETEEKASYDPPVIDERATWFPVWAWDVATDGSILVAAARDTYRIDWYEPDGTLRCVITRPFQPCRRTAEEKHKVERGMRIWRGGTELEAKKIVLDAEPVIKEIRVHGDGRIWVRSCHCDRDLPEGILQRYDVFDATGHIEGEVQLAWQVKLDNDYFDMLDDDRVIWYRNGRSAVNARFATVEKHDPGDEGLSDEGIGLQVIMLARDR